jgi:hypothetical protein
MAAAMAILVSAGPMAVPAPPVPSGNDSPIRLDAIVTDRNDRPIRDLKLSDVEISDAGESRPVDGLVRQSGGNKRLVAIFLDEYHVQAGESTERTRAALMKFVDTELRPDDMVAIMKPLDPLNSIPLLNVGETMPGCRRSSRTLRTQRRLHTHHGVRAGLHEPRVGPTDASRAQIVSSALQSLAIRVATPVTAGSPWC